MKPIQLRLAGLQSYREEQTIRFDQLIEAGVFGIFGPTGSGKSSILDAMTLALYGTVERAANGTQGIMNQSEPQLSVSFEFELNAGGKRERYRAERVYRRKNDQSSSVDQRVCRLIRIGLTGEPDEVLADKANDMKTAIQALLGLEMDDFTRAVVLPQGKFAEFLSLTGSERRKMLERLFHLEQYGDHLNKRISERNAVKTTTLKATEAEQLGIGDASEASLQLARDTLAAAKQSETEARTHENTAKEASSEATKLRELTTQWQECRVQHQQLQAEETHIAELDRRLRLAEQAEKLRPFLADSQKAEQELHSAELARNDAMQAAQSTDGQLKQAETAYQQAKTAYETQQGSLRVDLVNLKQAQQLQKDMQGIDLQVHQQQSALDDKRQEHERLTNELQTAQDELNLAHQEQSSHQLTLDSLVVSPEVRQQVHQAYILEQEIKSAAEQLQKVTEERTNAQSALHQYQQELFKTNQQYLELKSQSDEILDQAHRVELNASELIRCNRALEMAAPARMLALELKAGNPCPVCGSLEHPAVQHGSLLPSPSTPTLREDHLQQSAACAVGLVEERRKLLSAVDRVMAELVDGQGSSSQVSGSQISSPHELDHAFREAQFLGSAAAHVDMTAFLEECARSVRELRNISQNIHAWLQRFTEQKRQQLQLDQRIQNETERLQRSNIDYEAAEVKNNAKLVAWREQSYAFALGEAKQQQQHINEMDQRFQTEKQRMDQYERTIQHKSEVIKQFQAQQMQIHLTLVKLESELDSLKRQQTETLSRIHQIAGNEDISARLHAVEEKLRRLEEALAAAETQREHARQAAQTASTSLARAEQQLISATTQRDQALDRWNSAKAKSTLSEVELNQLESLMLSAEEQSTTKAKVEQYRQNLLTVEADLKRLESSLAGREMSEAEYEQVEETAKSATQQLEAAISAVAKATNDLDALNKKHERWNELESLRLQLSQEISLLQQLTKIFRGNAFVEYLAEEQLFAISKVASDRLIGLSRGRYRLELDSSGGFVIRDDANGGTSRPVSTLSGGETFLASLALALALSAQIQLSGKYPLEFFFLDEGFGTLDADLLDTVISALEKLHLERLTVGVISHVPELRSRLPRKLIVQPAEPFGKGSTVKLELM